MKSEKDTLLGANGSESKSKEKNNKKSSRLQTVFNFTNIFIGLGLLSQPYAVSQGGWLSLVILLIGTLLCQCTAKFVLNVTDQFLQRRPDGVPSYAEIGREAFGTWGYIISSTVVLLEISLAACISLVFVWNNVLLLFTESWQVSYAVIAAIATAATLPSVWIRNFSRISFIAIFGTFASIGVFIVVVVVFLLDPTVIRVNEYDFFKDSTISVAFGIYLTSLGGHACIPALYDSMEDKKSFKRVIEISFIVIFLVYALMATFGYLTYGQTTGVIITSSLSLVPGGVTMTIAAVCVILASYANLAPFTSVVTDIALDMLQISFPQAKDVCRRWAVLELIVRTGLLLVYFGIALLTYPYLNIVLSFSGGICSMGDSIILPSAFFLKLCWRTSTKYQKALAVFTLAFGVASAVYITISNIVVVSREK